MAWPVMMQEMVMKMPMAKMMKVVRQQLEVFERLQLLASENPS